MDNYTITAYEHRDFEPVVALLRGIFPGEPLSEESFAGRVLLDPNFDPHGAFVARHPTEGVVGFLLALTRRYPLEDAPSDGNRGWITLFGVAERARGQGVGSTLLQGAENWLRLQGRYGVWISPYAPNYWTPGVDETACPTGLAFLQRRGYTAAYRPLSMNVSLVGWQMPSWVHDCKEEQAKRGVGLQMFAPDQAGPLLDFLRQEFPGDWQRYLREAMRDMLMGKRRYEELCLLVQAGTVLGFTHCEGERFGPFGVAEAWRGQGLGAILLYETLEAMQQRGQHNAWFLWTDDTTAERLYKPAGFAETRRYTVLHKQLTVST